ncbi:MAG: response regulator [Bacteroidetes bacterium]|nr:response regulator [Bacteroidota bacterium]
MRFRRSLRNLKEREKEVEIKNAISIEECAELAKNNYYSGFIIGTGVTDSNWLDKTKHLESLKNIPTLIFENDDTSLFEEVEALVTLDPNKEKEKLLDNAKSFLHQVENGSIKYSEVKERMENMLLGKVVLIADDDMRNIYSLTNILEQEGIQVLCAYDGLQAIALLKENKNIDMVLMDIMMPNMNGYEATMEIRKNPEWEHLPVIAVTAKAMTGDREKCMESGASDYLTKPIQVDQLISLMKVWLYK